MAVGAEASGTDAAEVAREFARSMVKMPSYAAAIGRCQDERVGLSGITPLDGATVDGGGP